MCYTLEMENVHILWAYRPKSMHCAIPNMLLLQTKSNMIISKALQSSLEAWVVQRGSQMDSIVLGSFPFQRQSEDHFLLRNWETSLAIIENILWGWGCGGRDLHILQIY